MSHSSSLQSRTSRDVRAVAVQPKWHVHDFQSSTAFHAWLRGQLEHARPHLAPDRPNLVVLTELNGLPLLLQGAKLSMRAPTFELALALLVVRHLPGTLLHLARARVSVPRALMLTLATQVARTYLSVCRDLAREYRVYLVCGTAPLPHFTERHGRLTPAGRDVYNQAVILDPNGNLVGLTDKVHLTTGEGPSGLNLSNGRLEDLRVFPTPAGNLGVATSLDAFRADVIGHLDAHGTTVLLQPDANASPWTGQEQDPPSGRDQPLAWLDSAWTAVQQAVNIRYAVNPMVVGNLLGMAFDGQSAIVSKASETPAERSYVMTTPRPGFLALLPWVTDGPTAHLRETGRQLAPGSGHARENQYLTGVISADLHLPPPQHAPQPLRPHEQSVQRYLTGNATLDSSPAERGLTRAWKALGPALGSVGWQQLRAGRRKRGVACLLAGAALTALTW